MELSDKNKIETNFPSSLVPASIEQAAKRYAATEWKMIDDSSNDYDKEKYDSFLAGAKSTVNGQRFDLNEKHETVYSSNTQLNTLPSGFIDSLRAANPYKEYGDGTKSGKEGDWLKYNCYLAWEQCCAVGSEILNQKEETK